MTSLWQFHKFPLCRVCRDHPNLEYSTFTNNWNSKSSRNFEDIKKGWIDDGPRGWLAMQICHFLAHSFSGQQMPYFNVLRQKVPYFSVSRQNSVKHCWCILKQCYTARGQEPREPVSLSLLRSELRDWLTTSLLGSQRRCHALCRSVDFKGRHFLEVRLG